MLDKKADEATPHNQHNHVCHVSIMITDEWQECKMKSAVMTITIESTTMMTEMVLLDMKCRLPQERYAELYADRNFEAS